MKKKDLKTGMKCKLRNGKIAVIIQTDDGWNIVGNGIGHKSNKYNDDLIFVGIPNNSKRDIMKVYRGYSLDLFLDGFNEDKYHAYDLIWKRKEVPEYTMEELTEKLGYEFKIKKQ